MSKDRKRTLIDRDQLLSSDKTSVARLTVQVFDRLQQYAERKHEQLMALAAA